MAQKASGDMDFQANNQEFWDDRAPIHAVSPDYCVEQFVTNPSFISDVIGFDRPLLGDISGLTCVHLQCHIGTDTLSLARLGAASVVGLDFSEKSIEEARRLAGRTQGSGGSKMRFVQSNLFSAMDALERGSFDLVFTGIGSLSWISSIQRWAEVVSGLLKPGGRLFLREGHPLLDVLQFNDNKTLRVQFPYFTTGKPNICHADGTYVEVPQGLTTKPMTTHEFVHGIGDVVQALLDHGMLITCLKEHNVVPWNAFLGHMTKDNHGEWFLTEGSNNLPLSYTLQAVKVGGTHAG